jgi:hypothetical protein
MRDFGRPPWTYPYGSSANQGGKCHSLTFVANCVTPTIPEIFLTDRQRIS